ncbi:MAG: DUF6569 family protein [Ignavibacteria bacterium]
MLSKVLSFQSFGSLSVVQIATVNRNTFNFVSGTGAIKSGQAEVVETSESGSVNNLLVINHSGEFIFFMDGDILSGAKQNRVFNTSVLLAPESKSVIPVSCVESGRWNYKSGKFNSTAYSAPTKLRADKAEQISDSLKEEKGYYADQGKVWSNVESYSDRHHSKSGTSCLSDVFDTKEKDFEVFLSQYKVSEGANALAIFIDKKLMNTEVFGRTDIYDEYFPKLLKGAALEAFELKSDSNDLKEAEASYKAVTFLDKFDNIEFDEHKGAGVGIEKRFSTAEITGFELNYNNNLIHLTSLNRNLK